MFRGGLNASPKYQRDAGGESLCLRLRIVPAFLFVLVFARALGHIVAIGIGDEQVFAVHTVYNRYQSVSATSTSYSRRHV